MIKLAQLFYCQGYTLRTGAAQGADTAFEDGHDIAYGRAVMNTGLFTEDLWNLGSIFGGPAEERKEIYIPWNGFSDRKYNGTTVPYRPSDELEAKANQLVDQIHPNPYALTQGARKLHARNCYQVLGRDLQTPSEFLVCWTLNGQDIGGTRTAICLARMNNIPVWNLGRTETEYMVRSVLSWS